MGRAGRARRRRAWPRRDPVRLQMTCGVVQLVARWPGMEGQVARLHGLLPAAGRGAGRDERGEVHGVGRDGRVVRAHRGKHLQRRLPRARLGARVQQRREGGCLRLERRARDRARYLARACVRARARAHQPGAPAGAGAPAAVRAAAPASAGGCKTCAPRVVTIRSPGNVLVLQGWWAASSESALGAQQRVMACSSRACGCCRPGACAGSHGGYAALTPRPCLNILSGRS